MDFVVVQSLLAPSPRTAASWQSEAFGAQHTWSLPFITSNYK
jgi:hypothetical protein